MSIWGKILGGAAGFALGGPLGALLGGLAGHAVDAMQEDIRRLSHAPGAAGDTQTLDGVEQQEADTQPEGTRQIAFTIGVIVLGAKMAKADGQVTPAEIRAFRQVFHIPEEEVKNVGRVFDLARRDSRGYEPYARQIGRLFKDNPAVLEQLLEGLFHIARADGAVGEAELRYLEGVARCFGFDEAAWRRIRIANLGEDPASSDPYAVLGVAPDASDEEIKQRHRALVREHHPDRLTAQGLPPEFVKQATDKLARINAAYDAVRKLRGQG